MVGIVIVSYMNQEGTVAFINEQLPKISVPWKAVVVDNSPDERVGKMIAERSGGVLLRHPDEAIEEQSRVYVFSTLKNLGFACGNNLGANILVRNFAVDYLLFSNDDIIISDSQVMEKMILQFARRQDVAIVGPRRWFRRKKMSTPQSINQPQSGYWYRVSGCFYLVRKTDFAAVGGFDPRTFLYSEEVILSERMKCIGKRAYFIAEASVVHLGGCSTKNLQNKALRNYLKQSNCIYYRNYLHSNLLFIWLYKMISK